MRNQPKHQQLAFTLKEAAEITGVPTSTLRKLIRSGKLNPITGFGRWRVTQAEIDRLMSQRLRNNESGKVNP